VFGVEVISVDAPSKFFSYGDAAMLSARAANRESDVLLSFSQVSLADTLEERDIAVKKFAHIVSAQNCGTHLVI
jgi:hypothetical protein